MNRFVEAAWPVPLAQAQCEGSDGKYLNNLIKQGHCAITRRCASMAGFKSFKNAAYHDHWH